MDGKNMAYIIDPRFEANAYNRQMALHRGRQASQIYDYPKKIKDYFKTQKYEKD